MGPNARTSWAPLFPGRTMPLLRSESGGAAQPRAPRATRPAVGTDEPHNLSTSQQL